MQAVILAGGKGKRMAPLTDTIPKPLLPVGDCPLLSWTLASLPKDLSEILIVTGYLSEQIEDFAGTTYQNTPLSYFKQEPLEGTDSAIRQALASNKLRFPCLVVNGDDLYHPKDLQKLCHNPTQMKMLVWERSGPLKSAVQVNPQGFITGLADVHTTERSYECCGAYFLTQEYPSNPSVPVKTHAGFELSLPHTLAKISEKYPVKSIKAGFWQRIGTPEQLKQANLTARSGQIPINMGK